MVTCEHTGWDDRVAWHCDRCVLRVRCDHFRARCDSGMRDASDDNLHVPEHFSKVRDPSSLLFKSP